jgi:hypothetical protein
MIFVPSETRKVNPIQTTSFDKISRQGAKEDARARFPLRLCGSALRLCVKLFSR